MVLSTEEILIRFIIEASFFSTIKNLQNFMIFTLLDTSHNAKNGMGSQVDHGGPLCYGLLC